MLVNGARAITVNLWPDKTTQGTPLCSTVASSRADRVAAFVAVQIATARAGQIEISADGVTIRVREDLDSERLANILDVVTRRGRGC